MRKLLYILIPLIAALAIFVAGWQISKSRTYQFFGEIVPRVEVSEKVVALTFDDGPTPGFTDEILKILESEDVKATFFLIGSELEKHPDEGKKIITAEHEIGNHSYSHKRMVLVSPSFVREEVEKTDSLIRSLGYNRLTHFRPPYGKKLFVLPYYLSSTERKTITWDIAPESYTEVAKSTDAIVDHTVSNTTNGSIILLHVMYDRERKSLNAVLPIIKGLKEKGFRFVTVSELIALQ